jgi:hypothetical protein
MFFSSKESQPKTISDEQKNSAFQRVKELLARPDESAAEHDNDEDCTIQDDQIEAPPNSMIWRFLRAYSYDPNVTAPRIRFFLFPVPGICGKTVLMVLVVQKMFEVESVSQLWSELCSTRDKCKHSCEIHSSITMISDSE